MITALDFVFFFFSSRRRHTRSLCDWSSDVCSSDLVSHAHRAAADRRTRRGQAARRGGPLRPPILLLRSEERRVGKSVDLGGRRMSKKKKIRENRATTN